MNEDVRPFTFHPNLIPAIVITTITYIVIASPPKITSLRRQKKTTSISLLSQVCTDLFFPLVQEVKLLNQKSHFPPTLKINKQLQKWPPYKHHSKVSRHAILLALCNQRSKVLLNLIPPPPGNTGENKLGRQDNSGMLLQK